MKYTCIFGQWAEPFHAFLLVGAGYMLGRTDLHIAWRAWGWITIVMTLVCIFARRYS